MPVLFKCMDLERIREAAERVARSEGMEVVDVEWKVGRQRFLRVYIDKPSGPGNARGSAISHRDCEVVSQQLSVILDVEELVPGPRYILEISSPGMDRKLIKPSDYERFVGRLARIWTNEPVELPALDGPGEGRTSRKAGPASVTFLEGRLAGYADGRVKIAVRGREPEILEVPFAAIRKANLVVEF